MVLGAESMTQVLGPTEAGRAQFLKAYSNARKLFQIRKLPGVGALTYGAGNMGNRSIESFLDEFIGTPREPDDRTVEQIANELRDFLRGPYHVEFGQMPEGQQPPSIGFYVAGYSPGEHIGSEWEFVFPEAEVRTSRPNPVGASWRGVSLPFTRLYTGIDPRLAEILHAQGVPPQTIENIREQARRLVSPVAFDGMPVQDAIGYCKFILETTIQMATYELGVPSCGGPLHIAVITRRDGFQWVSEPKYTI